MVGSLSFFYYEIFLVGLNFYISIDFCGGCVAIRRLEEEKHCMEAEDLP